MNNDNQNTTNLPDKTKRNPLASLLVTIVGLASAFYLINPGAGVFELIPDNLPFVGNIDEAGAVALLISCLAYWGLDAGALFGRGGKKDKDEKTAKGSVIER